MRSSYEITKSILHTEKSTLAEPQGKYLFLVDVKANKVQVKNAIEEIYKVKVADVNTSVVAGKMRRVRHQAGRTPDSKKAVVTLKEGQKISEAAV